MRSKLLAVAVIAAFALGATIVSASASHSHKSNKAVTLDSAPTVNCGSGTVPVLHTMNPTHYYWSCVKPS
jgi:hypothetical protein